MATGSARLSVRSDSDGGITIALGGSWRAAGGIPEGGEMLAAIESLPRSVRFDAGNLEDWDSALVAFVAKGIERAKRLGLPTDTSGLPEGVRHLLELAATAPERAVDEVQSRASRLARIGNRAVEAARTGVRILALVGGTTYAFSCMIVGRARFRPRELFLLIELAGARGFAVVGLVSFLVGMIFAFVGAVQLEAFGAEIFIADLVGIAMVREMGALMAGIVAAGRTGAAYAAELGTMRVSQEIDALVAIGISPMEFLVAPRIAALTLMLPLLCLYADLLGVLGGALVGVGMMGIGARAYYQQTIESITTAHLLGGIFKAAVYGALVAGAGCFEGMRSGRSASSVGLAATAAVVDGIVLVIAACGFFAAAFYFFGI